MEILEFTHRRKNPLTGDWVLVSPHRNARPWQGANEVASVEKTKEYDPKCPLCPGNQRANDITNPNYRSTHIFTNDFGALLPDHTSNTITNEPSNDLFECETATGMAKVICYSPAHNKTLPELPESALVEVVKTWHSCYLELSEQYNCIHLFENKGEIMGCSQPHPHGQAWAHDHWSNEINRENQQQQDYFDRKKSALLADYVKLEIEEEVRVVAQNKDWLVVVPYWAAWPFETLLIPKFDIRHLGELEKPNQLSLARILKEITVRYDNLFQCSFPYSMGWHNAPGDLQINSHWRLHAHFYPPLLRSATIKKHMVGYEMLAESQRDITPEKAADLLRSVPTVHYLVDH